jgi:thymidylate synthase (FAD)
MKIIDPFYEIMYLPDGEFILKHIELAARTCYKSEEKITTKSASKILKTLLKSGHHSVFEHIGFTIRFICDRGISHEIVRHRLCAFSQESTRYANYSKDKFGNEITVIRPFFFKKDSEKYKRWQKAIQYVENAYITLIEMGASAQEARSVLPNSLKTEVVVSANLREWRHILNLRCNKASHPQIRQLMLPLLYDLSTRVPIIFDDMLHKYEKDINEFVVEGKIGGIPIR